jgi:hypothetical protein
MMGSFRETMIQRKAGIPTGCSAEALQLLLYLGNVTLVWLNLCSFAAALMLRCIRTWRVDPRRAAAIVMIGLSAF